MKKLILSLMLLACFAAAKAQKSELSSAKNNYALYEVSMQTNTELKKKLEPLNAAKTSIDKASTHDKTKDVPEVWAYKSMIYSALAVTDTVNKQNAETAFKTALESIAKAKELDKDGENAKYIENSERNLSIMMQNKGVAAYNTKNFKEAFEAFKYIANVIPQDSAFSMYAAIAAKEAQMPEEAIDYYGRTLKLNTKNPGLYQELGRLYLAKRDTANALPTFGEGRIYHPTNKDLMFDELNIYISRGEIASQISKIEQAISQEPDNKTLYFILGVAYSSSDNIDKAEEAYKKAIELDPSYSDAVYNLAVIYINRGNGYINEANKLPSAKSSDAKYNALKAQFDGELKKALPLLETAREQSPRDVNILRTLQEVYVKLNQMDKAAAIKEELKQL